MESRDVATGGSAAARLTCPVRPRAEATDRSARDGRTLSPMTQRRRRCLVAAALLVGLGVAAFILDTLYVAGSFKRIVPHFEGTCRKVPITGVEDMTAALDDRDLFLSSDDRRAAMAGHATPGAIWLYDLTGETPPRRLTPETVKEFHPHGIGYWPVAPGRGRVFVVNHPDGASMGGDSRRHSIEIFDWADGQLVHRSTLSDAALFSPNDIVAVGPDRFYVTNDHGNSGFARTIEEWFRLARANVVYFDGKAMRVAAEGIAFANGINVSEDGRTLYVASTIGRALLVYDRDPETGVLTNRRDVSLYTAPDNIERAADGHLWIGAHPKLLRLVDHAKDAKALSPSQVLEVTPRPDGSFLTSEIFLDDGSQLSASSVALRSGKHLLVGPVFDDHFLDCTMP
jgi:arylesterase / paraoxonase